MSEFYGTREFRKTAQDIANYLWKEFLRSGGKLPKKSNCLWQVHGVLEGLHFQLTKAVCKRCLELDKLILLALNQRREWLKCRKGLSQNAHKED